PAEYTVLVRNTSLWTVQKVVAKVRLPAGMAVQSTKPNAATEGEFLVWQLGTLLPRQEKRHQLQLVVNQRGDVSPQAWVTFTGISVAAHRIHVHEPKLALKVASPPRLLAGDAATFLLTVSNSGDGVASQVKVQANLSEGLESPRGKSVAFQLGDLAVGESRT